MLANISWSDGSRDGMIEHLDQARALVAGAPASRIQVSVLSDVARYEMLADHNESALEAGREALEMAKQLGLDELRAHALNSIGSARVAAGDPGGVDDLEESIALATRLNAVTEIVRAMNNFGVMNHMLGRLPQATEAFAETRRLAEHFGLTGFLRFLDGGPTVAYHFNLGRWDEAIEAADGFLASLGSGSHYQESSVHVYRALILIGRGDPVRAQSDANRAVEFARRVQDPQILETSLTMAAVVFLSAGDEARASQIFDEVLAELRGSRQLGFTAVVCHYLAWVAWTLDRGDELLDVLKREPLQTPWLEAARAAAVGDFGRTADILGEIGTPSREAFFRLRRAEQLVAEGRRAEADEQLHRALAFYRSVGATRYIREGEALLAATG
jgi:tetratricopeptide (TPR) repeat protein